MKLSILKKSVNTLKKITKYKFQITLTDNKGIKFSLPSEEEK